MKTTYPRTVTQRIIELQAVGFSAEETRSTLKEQNGISITLNTVYRHRKSAVGQEIVEELIRRQERSILKADTDDPALAMKYRNELLKILVPQRIEAYTKVDQNVNTTVTNINVALRDYQWALEEAARLNLQSNNKAKPVDSPQATSEASPVPTT